MTTDITELAQQELAQLRAELSNPAIGNKDHLRKLALSLVEALEHYKSREERVTKLVHDNSKSWDELYQQLEAKDKRNAEQTEALEKSQLSIAELESRTVTVKLPDEVNVLLNHLEEVLPPKAFRLIDVHKWNAVSRLSATGIKWEAE